MSVAARNPLSLVAKNTRRIILERGYKQNAIAQKAGYNEKIFSAMLTDRRRIIDVDIIRIANALEVTPNDLFVEERTP